MTKVQSALNRERIEELPQVYHRPQDSSLYFEELPEVFSRLEFDPATGTQKVVKYARKVKRLDMGMYSGLDRDGNWKSCGVSNLEHASNLVSAYNHPHRRDVIQGGIKHYQDNFNASLEHFNVCWQCWKPIKTQSISVFRVRNASQCEDVDLAIKAARAERLTQKVKRSVNGKPLSGLMRYPSTTNASNTIAVCKSHYRLARYTDGRWFYFLYTGAGKPFIGRRMAQRTAPTGQKFHYPEFYNMETGEVVNPPTEYLEIDFKCECRKAHKA